MNEKKTGLEAFVERHRADFDAFEPRPNLWDDIELELDTPTATADDVAPLRIVRLDAGIPVAEVPAPQAPAAPVTAEVRAARPYGIAAAVAALALLGGWFWQQQHSAPSIWMRSTAAPVATAAPSARTYDGVAATAAAASPEQRLAGTVQRMESYYATQITERQQELQALDAETKAAPRADWQQELTALDSTYQQLKTELYRNPEPDVVLEAMNRNLQIRLDLLTQQLRTRERIRDYHSQPYMVAETRRTP
ncbi:MULTISPECIES: hypothetical protein [Hymenobacter]|uniref:Uncharacterized protein n=1 Tax=Hymenobacter mucosus TaxID=1411120 RepID=A0A238WCT6_9BACT|nr:MULTISPECIES: hypothetical protein [Hymenobacter]SNR44360.1 hypothetical protein SAMN06269173_102480 [Hymenobacter mucosus]